IDTDSLLDSSVATPPASAVAPVEPQTDINHEAVESAEDFSSRFAADFDFVKSLDSNQVTLDLANQYLQLGEYDSAKRLLNEVIAQGNSEQKQQAQLLLERTA
ncbi:FimV/HubP family polar landmark protein, partial [Psychrobacter sp. 1Y4]|uniref:FimV/HubP family polar landmark protein n=1 Tax=Psychrobacter sp. 1Y4 TaxID=3453575 RepID=UPI003F44AAF1